MAFPSHVSFICFHPEHCSSLFCSLSWHWHFKEFHRMFLNLDFSDGFFRIRVSIIIVGRHLTQMTLLPSQCLVSGGTWCPLGLLLLMWTFWSHGYMSPLEKCPDPLWLISDWLSDTLRLNILFLNILSPRDFRIHWWSSPESIIALLAV